MARGASSSLQAPGEAVASGSTMCPVWFTLDWARGDFDSGNSVPPVRFLAYEGSSSFGLPSHGTLFSSRGVMCERVTQIRHSASKRVIAGCIHFFSRSEIVWHLDTRGSLSDPIVTCCFWRGEKMNYHDHNIDVRTLTMSGIFTLHELYVPTQKQTENLQGSWKGTDHGLMNL